MHIASFRDSERQVADFFSSHGMSLKATTARDTIRQARRLAGDIAVAARMTKRQERLVRPDAADRILDVIFKGKIRN